MVAAIAHLCSLSHGIALKGSNSNAIKIVWLKLVAHVLALPLLPLSSHCAVQRSRIEKFVHIHFIASKLQFEWERQKPTVALSHKRRSEMLWMRHEKIVHSSYFLSCELNKSFESMLILCRCNRQCLVSFCVCLCFCYCCCSSVCWCAYVKMYTFDVPWLGILLGTCM